MKREITGLVMSLILTSPSFGRSKSSQREQPTAEITIRIRDYAHSAPLIRQHAEQVAGEILQKAGVATHWIDCPVASPEIGACASPVSTLDFFVNLLPESMSDHLHMPGGVLGSAIEGSGKSFGFIASVFYDVARDRAADRQLDFGELLGDALAHELGHLLLGTNSHSGRGLMCAFWSGNQFRLVAQGGLAFSDPEEKRIRAAMEARTLAATALTQPEQSFATGSEVSNWSSTTGHGNE